MEQGSNAQVTIGNRGPELKGEFWVAKFGIWGCQNGSLLGMRIWGRGEEDLG